MSGIRYFSVCSGIESATLAWRQLGWRAIGFAEIEPFPSAVLAHHYPDVPNFGDFTAIDTIRLGQVDLLVGGTPCQAFSVAGKRHSLSDTRGNLSLAYVVLAHELARSNGLRWAVWENVPGVLSTKDNAFGCFLGALVGHDGAIPAPRGRAWTDAGMVAGPWARCAWRVLDAQYFGLAQRRKRVFVVVGFGDGADPAAVLFEPQGVRRHPPSRDEAPQDAASTTARSIALRGREGGGAVELGGDIAFTVRASGGGGDKASALIVYGGNNTAGPIDLATAVNAHGGPCGCMDFESETFVTHALRGEGFDASEDGTGRGTPIIPIAFNAREDCVSGPIPGALGTAHPQAQAIAFDTTQITSPDNRCNPQSGDPCHPLTAEGHPPALATGWAVRRLMPIETERLQGIPPGYTAIPSAADGPRYKTHGNAMAVNCMRWIGERIDAAHKTAP